MFDPIEDFAAVADNLEPVTLLRRGGVSTAIAYALTEPADLARSTFFQYRFTLT
jgi:hypothetical protein